MNKQEKHFSEKKAGYRKDVERAFGILHTTRAWSLEKLNSIIMACMILHNMVVEDERDDYIDGYSDDDEVVPNRSRRARARIYDGHNLL